jgi:hypothetical protein
MGIGDGNNLRNGVDVEVGCGAVVGMGVDASEGVCLGDEVRGPERGANPDQSLPRSISAGEPNVGSTTCIPVLTSKRITQRSKLNKTNNDALRNLPDRSLDKTVSLLIPQRFPQEDTTIQQDCQAVPNSYAPS